MLLDTVYLWNQVLDKALYHKAQTNKSVFITRVDQPESEVTQRFEIWSERQTANDIMVA